MILLTSFLYVLVNLLIDLSRNHSRRFCDDGCGNRANVAAYRARRRGDAGTSW